MGMKLPIPVLDIAMDQRDDEAKWRLNWLIGIWFGWVWSSELGEWLAPDGDPVKEMPDYIGQLSR